MTCNSNLVPLLDGLCSLNPCRVQFWDFWVFAGIKPKQCRCQVSGTPVMNMLHIPDVDLLEQIYNSVTSVCSLGLTSILESNCAAITKWFWWREYSIEALRRTRYLQLSIYIMYLIWLNEPSNALPKSQNIKVQTWLNKSKVGGWVKFTSQVWLRWP